MTPAPGERLLRFVGDTIRFTFRGTEGQLSGARLRTNLGRGSALRREIIESYSSKLPLASASWRDIPFRQEANGEWTLELMLAETGFFYAKAYVVDADGRQHWPDGSDVGVSVHPSDYRTANTIYCAFTRMFGDTRTEASTEKPSLEAQLAKLDTQGFTVIPPSGKLRDLTQQLPHIIDTLGCWILHLLPINPTPTAYARLGRFGSPYAALDLTAIDPALVEFDRRTTGIDQFCELTYATHLKGGRVFLDIVINHTGWGSRLQEEHPEWFLRDDTGKFVSPGAWGVVWEDLVELNHSNPASWDELAEMFLVWCRRGVDGFRCDAGYKVPMHAWRYIAARVHDEFPETIFLLEGLGGSWAATESLLTDGGMQWAYSELFQNYSGAEVAGYLDYALNQSRRVGLYVHYSETHDNDRLAKRGRAWSLLRNRLCALTSVSGAFAFTCGVEWLAAEKISVHANRGLSWGSSDNLIPELAALNRLLAEHPCFFDDAKLSLLSERGSSVYALRRDSVEGLDRVLVLVNTDVERAHTFRLSKELSDAFGEFAYELLNQQLPSAERAQEGSVILHLPAGAAYCLSPYPKPQGLAGDAYRRARACAAFAVRALAQVVPLEDIGFWSWLTLAEMATESPYRFLGALAHLDANAARTDLAQALSSAMAERRFAQVVRWHLEDVRRVTLIPPKHWLLIEDTVPFRASLEVPGGTHALHEHSIQVQDGYVAAFPSQLAAGDARLHLERYTTNEPRVEASLRFLPLESIVPLTLSDARTGIPHSKPRMPDVRSEIEAPINLLTNGRGGMARMCVNLGQIKSKYDCALAANLHPAVPVDRHVLVKRIRAWSVADGFVTPLDEQNLFSFDPGPPAHWRFVANAGDGRTVEIHLEADMLEGRNTTVFRFARPPSVPPLGRDLSDECNVSLSVRVDIEDRNFHWETKRNGGAEHHFASHCQALREKVGFEFTPTADRQLRAVASAGRYHPQAEWCENIPHPIEASRGQTGSGDAYSPGWFELPLRKGDAVVLLLTADSTDIRSVYPSPSLSATGLTTDFTTARRQHLETAFLRAGLSKDDSFGRQLVSAVQAFVAQRDGGKTIIAGYPWFLDWGRDSLICARGLLAAGLVEEVVQLLVTFGRFEQHGTLPNSIHGENAANRDTSDAQLWFGVVCDDLASAHALSLLEVTVDRSGRKLADVLRSIAEGYLHGTPNGIRVDAGSALVWSPSHFTWMDTNHPAGTPRAGYPVEIQALWIRLLRLLARMGMARNGESWTALAERAERSLHELFWMEERGYLADVLVAEDGRPAAQAVRSDALRSNGLLAVSLGLLKGESARRVVDAALRHLVVPGALRSLARLPVSPPLPIYGPSGLLNDPNYPYWGRYEGDEDTCRKPAYHNGTAWTWTFPIFCEALARAWDFQTEAVMAARAYLRSMERLLHENCLGHIPEVLDGDAPHTQRGCDAQAWGATEALRVWKALNAASRSQAQ